ncbi:hypothetical protein E1161_03100 [Saccharopolyspora aridisoli]|uniref:Uncharacterized protein n=1 Tax=Saccharopolyspora aridisoli TaxID=2530385 RepID=A0A4R4V2A2_9PSEU|nr:hypothetical protein [Saccharopolyspora aridisoli]TDC95794.1 hypothetical protein E1161_03100 [Saccharopolyspora aridisoli]
MTPEERKLAVVFCQAQWLLEDAAHDVPADRYTRHQSETLAATLEELAGLVRARVCPVQSAITERPSRLQEEK